MLWAGPVMHVCQVACVMGPPRVLISERDMQRECDLSVRFQAFAVAMSAKADMVLGGILPIDNLTDFGPSVDLLVSKV